MPWLAKEFMDVAEVFANDTQTGLLASRGNKIRPDPFLLLFQGLPFPFSECPVERSKCVERGHALLPLIRL